MQSNKKQNSLRKTITTNSFIKMYSRIPRLCCAIRLELFKIDIRFRVQDGEYLFPVEFFIKISLKRPFVSKHEYKFDKVHLNRVK